ncbi:hypothetical protein [Micromonospora inyonensis]|uniref:Uncharacterized protein n=1 Tax=Micromonospora inyonensis TaxID=47866 RepID=A0A1C6RD12_9ACTN|nr:hypothetical protein [Micromonospora inyonensis]SCL15027.1 hypothetical protein GA0074694_1021 [Micromonospora inyonensis]
MDTGVLIAVVTSAGVVGAGATGTIVAHILGRRLRAAQIKQTEAQAEQLKVQTALVRQDIYQQLTDDLRNELARVKADLDTTRESLRITSAEEERLRTRVLELESRVAELASVREERDRLRIDLAARDATIQELQRQVGDLKVQLALTNSPTT